MGATHFFISASFARAIDRSQKSMGHKLIMSLPSREVMIFAHWLHIVPLYIARRKLHNNLISLEMMNYDMILGIDFLKKYSASIER